MNGGGKLSQCSEDITIEDSVVYLGVGITIGSVPPDPLVNCIRNVTFRRIQLVSPIKGIHVKPVGYHCARVFAADVCTTSSS